MLKCFFVFIKITISSHINTYNRIMNKLQARVTVTLFKYILMCSSRQRDHLRGKVFANSQDGAIPLTLFILFNYQ